MITCSRRIQFCAGHRVFGHENKCSHMHGHNYVVEIEAAAIDGLDTIGRVVDFSVIKESVGRWIDTYWDHGFILQESDEEARKAIEGLPARSHAGVYVVKQKVFCMPLNPTAENIADYLLRTVCPSELARFAVVVISVVVHETENCKAISFLTPAEFQGVVDAKFKDKQDGQITFAGPVAGNDTGFSLVPGDAPLKEPVVLKTTTTGASDQPSDRDSSHFIKADEVVPGTWTK